jgi:uncharacterized protein DUF6624
MHEALRQELLALRSADEERREELVREGTLWDGYHPRMQEVHDENAARLQEIIAQHGWPTRAMVGDDGAEAAWIIVQHAIGNPPFQCAMLPVLKEAAGRGDIPAYQPAYLEDRICFFEGRPQLYGTQFAAGDDGLPTPWTIADPEHVNERRAVLGLDTIEERTAGHRKNAATEPKPANSAEYRRRAEEWMRNVGWRK